MAERKENEVFEQDAGSSGQERSHIFSMRLLFDKEVPLPGADEIRAAAEGFLRNIDDISADGESVSIALFDRSKGTADSGNLPVMLLLTACFENDNSSVEAFERSQMWDCPDHERILEESRYSIAAADLLAGALPAQDRAELEMDWLSVLLKLFPECRAVLFMNSSKLFTAEDILARGLPDQSMFTYYAVNTRFFRIQGTEDMIVDTLGMDVLSLPDLQYHFHGADPNHVIRHAYNVLCYILDSGCAVKNGDSIDGFDGNGELSQDIQWRCSFEQALIQPKRDVLDINMGSLASGGRG